MKTRMLATGLLAGTLVLGACSDTENVGTQPSVSNIVETAVNAGSFTTLVQALKAAGLDQALTQPGPFTVFAPTDAAFAALPAGTLNALLADPDALAEVLLYHVLDGEVPAADVVKLTTAATLQGGLVAVDASNGVRINDAAVVTPDIRASNGVIHVIDRVLLPPSMAPEPAAGSPLFIPRGKDPIAAIAINGGFKQLVAALGYVDARLNTGLVNQFLNGTDQYTVFAPTDQAFESLYQLLSSVLSTQIDEITDVPPEVVRDVLFYHVTTGRRSARTVVPFALPSWVVARFPWLGVRRIQTLLGEPFYVRSNATIRDGLTGVRSADAAIVQADISASNGIIHVVNQVIVPPSVVAALTK